MTDERADLGDNSRDNGPLDENKPVDMLFIDVLGPEYWVANSGVTRRSWEILLLRKAMLDDHNWSLAECAERYGISRERVRQLEDEAVKKLLAWKEQRDRRRTQKPRAKRGVCRRMPPVQAFSCSEPLLGEAMPMFRKHKTFAELREGLLARLDFDARLSEF